MKQLFRATKLPRKLTYICLSLLLLTLPVRSQSMKDTDRDRQAIRSVIEQQIRAFQQDDARTAFSFASPEIRGKFGTPEVFMQMVKSAYPAVYRPRSVMFEQLKEVDGMVAQAVLLLAPDGNLERAIYLMEKQVDGTWKINGCYLEPIEGTGEII